VVQLLTSLAKDPAILFQSCGILALRRGLDCGVSKGGWGFIDIVHYDAYEEI
jgi:hypothetical protein